jgi:PE family/PPE-SVP subfamily C-terminal region
MAFVSTVPAELLAAQGQLTTILSNLEAQNAGAGSATTVVSPAAADPVSIQQSALFSAYGTQYQTTAAAAQTQLQQYASTLGVSSNAYGDTEAVNAAQATLSNAANSPVSAAATQSSNTPLDWLAYLLGSTGNGTNSSMLGGIFGLSSNGANIGNIGVGNWASAGSDLLGLAGGGLVDTSADAAGAGLAANVAAAPEAAGVAGAGMAGGMVGMGGVPVASMGSATMVSSMSVPPSWAGTYAPVASPVTAVQTAGWTAAAPQAGMGNVVPGMPGMATAGRSSAGFGAPRYGVKPIVMPKPKAV